MSKYCPKHGSHNCQKCADEILALGIQCDKDRIATLTAELAEAREQRDSLRDECEGLREQLTAAVTNPDDPAYWLHSATAALSASGRDADGDGRGK